MSIHRSENFGQRAPRGPRFRPKPKWCPLGNAHAPRYGAAERRQRIQRSFTRQAEHRWGRKRTEERAEHAANDAQTLYGLLIFINRVWARLFPPYKPPRVDPDIYHVDGGLV